MSEQLGFYRRPPQVRASFLHDEIVVDNFAGGGGASTGIETALGRPVDLAINHDREAIAMHEANHPQTRHLCESVWKVDPREVCGGRKVGLAWFSPDCTHHSRAKGSVPLKKEIRALAWIVVRWAKAVRPRVIVLENVEEFEHWGPLTEDGRPCPERRGSTYREWLGRLHALGYRVESRSLVAADYGAPTTRKRLFLVARCDDAPIEWPRPTHGAGRRKPWRAAAEIIDWSLPVPSIFGRPRPLAEATLRRIAEGIRRFVVETPDPFVVPVAGEAAGATLIQTGYGERKGQAPRVPGLHKPLGTLVAGASKHALVAAFLSKHYKGVVGHGVQRPLGTITSKDHHSLTTATLRPQSEARGAQVRAFLTTYYGQGVGQEATLPLRTVTAKDRFGLVTVHGEEYAITDIGMRMLQPHELFAAQGFPDDYVIDPFLDGRRIGKTTQIRLVGNSVCPVLAEAMTRSQVADDAGRRPAA